MTPYENVLGFYLVAMEICRSSFVEIDEMELELLLDLISVYSKLHSGASRKVYIDDIL